MGFFIEGRKDFMRFISIGRVVLEFSDYEWNREREEVFFFVFVQDQYSFCFLRVEVLGVFCSIFFILDVNDFMMCCYIGKVMEMGR